MLTGFFPGMKLILSKIYTGISNRVSNLSAMQIRKSTFEDYSAALNACGDNGYNNSQLIDVVVTKTEVFEDSGKSNPMSTTFQGVNFFRYAPILLTEMSLSTLKVLDFGGAAGYQHSISNKLLGRDDKLIWSVVDTAKMVEKAAGHRYPNRKFFIGIKEALDSEGCFDIVTSSSSLQYCDDPLKFLRELVEVKAKYLLIQKTPLFNGQGKIVCLQKSRLSDNGPGPLPNSFKDKYIHYPITYVSEKDFEEILSVYYQIRFKVYEEFESFNFRGEKIHTVNYFCVIQ
jgi:putative methyltransferase (TIGR04325 family)